MELINPEGWARARGCSNVAVAEGRQVFVNLVEAVAAASGKPEVIGAHLPAMTMVQVSALPMEGARVEIDATAVIPCAERRGGGPA